MSWWLALPLLLLSVGVASAALVLALQARRDAWGARTAADTASRASRPLAREEARGTPHRLVALTNDVDQVQGDLERLERRLADLEARTASLGRELRTRPAPASAGGPVPSAGGGSAPSPEMHLRAHLAAQGYEDPLLLGCPGKPVPTWTVETRRGGLWSKGSARVHDDGRVEVRLEPALRAFP